MYIVYTEILGEETIERWYYGRWSDRNTANEVALSLGGEFPVYHKVCEAGEVKRLHLRNLPLCLQG